MLMDKKFGMVGLLVLGTAFWGISFPVTKMAMGSVSQSTFLAYRFLAATIVLAGVLCKQVSRITRAVMLDSVLLAVPLVFGIWFQTLGIKYTSASQCAFVAGISVIIIPVFKYGFYKKAIGLKMWIAALTALLGLFIISVKTNLSAGVGDVFTIIGAVGFAVYLITVERYNERADILPTIVPMFATCSLIMIAIALVDGKAQWLPSAGEFWTGIIYCAVFSTAYMYTISNLSQRYLKAEKVAIIYLFEPIFAAVAAVLILNEHLSWRLWIGGTLIVLGTLISELDMKRIFIAKVKCLLSFSTNETRLK